MSAPSQPRRSARLAAKYPSTPVKEPRPKECPYAPSKKVDINNFEKEFREMDIAASASFGALNTLKEIIKERGEHDKYTADALDSLICAMWAMDDALELKMRAPIIHGDSVALASVPSFIDHLRWIETDCQNDAVYLRQFHVIPRSIMIAIQTKGNAIRTSLYSNQ